MAKKVTRLYEQFAPTNYNINFEISKDKSSFSGSVVIDGSKTGKPSERITLHQKGLKITNPKVTKLDKKSGPRELKISRSVIQNSLDEVRFHFDETVYPGEYKIELEFSGKITDNMDGVYPSKFKVGDETKKIIATQFESHHAREAFPCVDEPEAKATFEFTLTHSKDEVALSNTSSVNEKTTGMKTITTFAKTPIMSTYLLAFVVGDIESKETKSKSGVLIRTFATTDQIENTEFALDVAAKCMDFYEDYYDIPFPLEKCDFVALPDFASGAMENWGLITFREQALLFNPEQTSKSTKQWVALVVAHELTHQWFGNLVTMRWWTDLWLNEGFASWMEYLAVDKLFPDWHLWTQFVVDEQQLALKLDALEYTHPIEVEVKHPDEIRTIFDAISYQKGASVIHMLHDYLGPDGFRDGLRHYLKTHAYKNTDTVDLWQALEDVTKKPVKEFMHAWTSASGFPLLEVEENNDHLKITQKRFVTNPESKARSDKTIWPIPLLTNGLDRQTVSKPSENVPFSGKDRTLKLNRSQTGFYRVNYSHDIQTKQINALKSGKFDDIDRMGLLADSIEATKAGYQPVSEYLDLLLNYSEEDSLSVWEIIAGSVGSIRSTLSVNDLDNSLREAMKPFIHKLVDKQSARLGWDEVENESHLDSLLRPLVIGVAAGADEDDAVKKALELYKDKISGKNHINPDMRGIVYTTAARHGDEKEFKELLNIYENSKSSDEKLSLTAAMCSFEQPNIHKKVFDLIKSDTIRTQDVAYWIAYSFMNRYARAETWKWLKENWKWLKETNGTDLSFSRMPIYAARNFADEEYLAEFKKFFEANMEPMLERSYNQGVEMIETNCDWRKRDSEVALKWFRDQA